MRVSETTRPFDTSVAVEKLIASLNIGNQKPDPQDSYKFEFAIDEAAESFSRANVKAKKYIHSSGGEFILVEEKLLFKVQQRLLVLCNARQTKIPGIFVLPTGKIKTLPKRDVEVFDHEKMTDVA